MLEDLDDDLENEDAQKPVENKASAGKKKEEEEKQGL